MRAESAAPRRPSVSPTALKSATASAIHPRFESLLDSQTGFDEKQSILQQMAQSGKLDAAIGELEQRARDQGPDPVVLATLGRTYLEKSGTLQDVREQGVLGLKTDQTFEQALAADSQNWDARYWKAFAMSFWPPQLGKTSEVMESLRALVQLQEAATPRPEFARSYVLLGEQYQRSGHDDYARQEGAWAFTPGVARSCSEIDSPAATDHKRRTCDLLHFSIHPSFSRMIRWPQAAQFGLWVT